MKMVFVHRGRPDFAAAMLRKRVCALTVRWRIFGQSGYRCQPEGSLLRHFVTRLPQRLELSVTEAKQITTEAEVRNLNPPFTGKPVYLYLSPLSPLCATHFCEECPAGFTNCAPDLDRAAFSASCERFESFGADAVWISHYAFQSSQHWDRKKKRGRTNRLKRRLGDVPRSYDRISDPSSAELLA